MTLTPTPARLAPIGLRAWIDLGVVLALGGIAVLGFAPTFGGASFLLAGIGGLIVGTLGALVGSLLRLGPLLTALTAVLLYFLLGTPFAMPEQALLVVLPSLDSLAGLAVGAVYGWADVITLTTPVAAPDYIAVVPYVAAWLTAFVGGTLALRWAPRARRSAAARSVVLLPALVLYVVGVLLGTDEAYLAIVRGVLFAVIALAWMLWRMPDNDGLAAATRSAILRRRLVGFGVVLGVAGLVGSLLGAITAPTEEQRFVLREQVEPPLEQYLFTSPLAGFRRYHQEGEGGLADRILFRVAGLDSDQRIRLVTMDYYDGSLWRVTSPTLFDEASGGFQLVGPQLPEPDYAETDGESTVTIEVLGYDDVWLPTVGYARGIDFTAGEPASTALRYNPMTGIPIVTSGVGEGMTYTVRAELQRSASLEEAATYSPARDVPVAVVEASSADVAARGQELSQSADAPFEKVLAIEEALASTGSLSHGTSAGGQPSVAGHNLYRLDQLMVQLVGDDEQYAAATALMADELGFPVRVVMGFAPEGAGASGPIDVVGSDATAWVEVAVDGLGWVALEPTPTQEVPPPPVPQPRSEPQPLIRQPPPVPNTQDDLVTPTEIVESDADDDAGFEIPAWVWALLGWTLIPLAIFLLPAFIVGALKARRRRRRRESGESDRRAAGAWDELVDIYAELGYRADRRSTRIGLALDFEKQFRAELAARRRERAQADDRDSARAAAAQTRAESRAEARERRSNPVAAPATPQLGAVDATVVRAPVVDEQWRPGVEQKHAPLPAIPGLREFAVDLDRAVFSANAVSQTELDRLWSELEQATQAARGSVTPMRRLLSRYRLRPRNDVVADLSDRLTAAAARRRPRGAPAS